MILKEVNQWDESFFKDFVSYKNQLYINEKFFIPEDLTDFEIMLKPNQAFDKYNHWWAILVLENEKIVGRIFCSTRNDQFKQNDFFPFGFFEANSFDVAKKLISRVEELAHNHHYRSIRGPIQGNVFFTSRFILKQQKRPFLSEPFHQRIYLNYLEDLKFTQNEYWVSIQYSFWARLKAMLNVFIRPKKGYQEKAKLHFRKFRPDSWDEECRLFYDITMDSFKNMKDVEIISFEEFKDSLQKSRYLIKPRNCFFVEENGEAVAYICAINDIAYELSKIAKTNSLLKFYYYLRIWMKLNMGVGRVLVLYLGKNSKAAHLPRVAMTMTKRLAKNNAYFLFNSVVFGYMTQDSITLNTAPDLAEIISEYATFSKNIK